MRTPQYLRPIHVSEFTALVLKVSLMEEVGRLTLAQDAARDGFDIDGWAMLEAKLAEVRAHLDDIRIGLAVLGPTPPKMLEEYARDIHRARHFMPRSWANREQWTHGRRRSGRLSEIIRRPFAVPSGPRGRLGQEAEK